MKKGFMTRIGLIGVVFGLITSPALAFQCPTLIRQANAKIQHIQALVAEAQRLHDAGQHAESVKKANEALQLLREVHEAKAESKPQAKKGYAY